MIRIFWILPASSIAFFEEEGFSNTRDTIAANIEVMRHNENCWIAAAMHDGQIVGAVAVTSMLYVEWGRLGEIGDIYKVYAVKQSPIGVWPIRARPLPNLYLMLQGKVLKDEKRVSVCVTFYILLIIP